MEKNPSQPSSILKTAMRTLVWAGLIAVFLILFQIFLLPLLILMFTGEMNYFSSPEFLYWMLPLLIMIALFVFIIVRATKVIQKKKK